MTEYWTVDPGGKPSDPWIKRAGESLGLGKLVAFPTESVYGLGADARNTAALERLFQAKGRPADNPLIIHIAELSQLDQLVMHCNEMASRLIARFWPGPLTIVLPVKENAVSPVAVAGLSTIAIRMPAHPVARSLLLAADCPVAAPSANRSGRPSPTTAEHVKDDLDGKIDIILDGGPADVGLESTVVECTDRSLIILRPGAVTAEQLKETAAGITVVEEMTAGHAEASGEAPRSPGMKYRHYAPQGNLTIVSGDSSARIVEWMQQHTDQARARGERTGILTFSERAFLLHADVVLSYGSIRETESMARNLYAALRAFDQAGISYILAEACEPDGLGLAVMNRLLKAAGNRFVHVE